MALPKFRPASNWEDINNDAHSNSLSILTGIEIFCKEEGKKNNQIHQWHTFSFNQKMVLQNIDSDRLKTNADHILDILLSWKTNK